MEKVRLFFAGDFCSTPSPEAIKVSDELKALMHSCDLRICNFEIPLLPDTPVQTYYHQHDDSPAFLESLGFDLFGMANNHAFDCGVEGFRKTCHALHGKTFGAGTYDEAYALKIVEVKGRRLGFMALTYAAKKGVFDDVAHHEGLGCAYIHDLRVNHDVMAAKQQVDYLFVLPHDGLEYIDVPLPETMARYRDLIDYGADAIIAAHPHCPQGWESYKGKMIFYSLGNFFFNSKNTPDFQSSRPHWYEGLCVLLTLSDEGISFEVVNTRNTNNRLLSLENTEARKKHNQLICHYLNDEAAYWQYLEAQLEKLAAEQEFPVVRRFYAKLSWPLFYKSLRSKLKAILTGRTAVVSEGLLMLAKNDSRRQGLIRVLRKNNNK